MRRNYDISSDDKTRILDSFLRLEKSHRTFNWKKRLLAEDRITYNLITDNCEIAKLQIIRKFNCAGYTTPNRPAIIFKTGNYERRLTGS